MFNEIVSKFREYSLEDRILIAFYSVVAACFTAITIIIMAVLLSAPAGAIDTGRLMLPPQGYRDMIITDPKTYVATQVVDRASIRLNTNTLARIQDARDSLRSRFVDKRDPEGRDFWKASTEGDCDDFALQLLVDLQAEFPNAKGAIGLATAFTENGIHHLVTTVQTNGGTLVCDVRVADCAYAKHFERIGYVFKMRFVAAAWWEAVQ